MRIEDHRLVGHAFRESPNRGGEIRPLFIVMHYTGTFGAAEAINHLCDAACANPVSAHVVLDLDGALTQLVPFNAKAWHAGRSSYAGAGETYVGLNEHSIGIEVANPGWFTRTAEGLYLHEGRNPVGAEKLAPFPAMVDSPMPSGEEACWACYPGAQMDILEELVRALLEAYPGIEDVVGHADIAPGRKEDPGPAFPMARFKRLLK
jgi:N-acetylmuramoyl-L-alanine amidase